jgi:hypothetical protein
MSVFGLAQLPDNWMREFVDDTIEQDVQRFFLFRR